MAKHKSNTTVADGATKNIGESQHHAPVQMERAAPKAFSPFRYAGGDLGLGNDGEPLIYFVDRMDNRFVTSSVEWILQNLDLFSEARCRAALLAGAALHYGLDAWALMGADLHSMWNVCDDSGKILLAGVTHGAASAAADEYMQRPDWSGDIKIRRQNADDGMFDPRHEGPLALLHHNLGATSFEGVAVRSHVGRCGMMLEEVLRRFDQFGPTDQAELLSGLALHFDLVGQAAGQRQQGVAA